MLLRLFYTLQRPLHSFLGILQTVGFSWTKWKSNRDTRRRACCNKRRPGKTRPQNSSPVHWSTEILYSKHQVVLCEGAGQCSAPGRIWARRCISKKWRMGWETPLKKKWQLCQCLREWKLKLHFTLSCTEALWSNDLEWESGSFCFYLSNFLCYALAFFPFLSLPSLPFPFLSLSVLPFSVFSFLSLPSFPRTTHTLNLQTSRDFCCIAK